MSLRYLVDSDWVVDYLMIGDLDLLIAATALRHELILLTNNRRHFERVRGLQIESA
jgi:predicted nucleic acid-binding protein